MSACGTFAVVGSAGGTVDMFNLQSGLRRQRFPPPKGKNSANGAATSGHTKAVTGIAIDGLNRNVVSCGLDGKLKVCCMSPEEALIC